MNKYGIEFEEFSKMPGWFATNIRIDISEQLFDASNRQINPRCEQLFMGCHPSDIFGDGGNIAQAFRCFYIPDEHPADVALAFEVGNSYRDDRLQVAALLRELYGVFPFVPLHIDSHRYHARFVSVISQELCKAYEALCNEHDYPGEEAGLAQSLYERQELVLWWD